MRLKRLSGLLFAVLAFCALGGFLQPFAQQAAPAPTAEATAAPPAPASSRSLIETGRLDLNQIEAALQRDSLDDRRLGELRQRLDPIGAIITDIIGKEGPRADEIKARIEQLGPAPDAAKGQTESPEVARDRAEQQRLFREADETLRLAKAQALRVEQVTQAIADRRRANFTREILAQHASILSPWLWLDVLKGLPADARALGFLSRQWAETIAGNLEWFEALVLLVIAGLGFLFAPRARQWVETGSFHKLDIESEAEVEPTALSKSLLALRMLALNVVVPALMLSLVYVLVDRFGLLPGRAATVFEQALVALAFVAFMNGLAGAVLAPSQPKFRIITLDDRRAQVFFRTIHKVTWVMAAARVLDALASAIVASLPLTLVLRGGIGVIVALLLANGARRAFGHQGAVADARDEPHLNLLPVRLAMWAAAIGIFSATLLGFIPLAAFLVTQTAWLTALVLIGVLAFVLIEDLIGAGLASEGVLGRRVRQATGLAASSLDQASVLGSGLARMVLLIALVMVALAPWGVDSSNLLGNLRAAFFGFQVGGITISLATVAVAIGLFFIGYFITRAIQNWLDTRYLPQTTLDPGLRNSIRTIFGYIGIMVAAGFALSQLGLSLDKITIVAGALSVGIGFGLQSIVSNFVSGLILLWERPIRVGDWVVVGDEQGTVKRINVRSTEIQTFDRASLIVPNSEFITGRVKNWVHSDRTARIIIPVNVEYEAEPEKVEAVLLEAALAHREVLSEPKPIVIFKNLGESGLDFELRCFADVDAMLTTRSELLFDIFRRLKAANLNVPYPTRRLEISNLPPMIDPRILAEAGWAPEADRKGRKP
jgi:small-conductance mechanosensitive channel